MSATEISAPRSRFLDGLCKTQGYNVVSEGERITVAFEPWAVEQVDAFEMPCLRLDFRQVDGRIVLQRFTVESGGELGSDPTRLGRATGEARGPSSENPAVTDRCR